MNIGYLGQEVRKRPISEILKGEDTLTKLKAKVSSLIGDFFKANEQLLRLKSYLRELLKRKDVATEAEKLIVENDVLLQRRENLERTALELSDRIGKLKTAWETDPRLKGLKVTPEPAVKILGTAFWVFIGGHLKEISAISKEAVVLSRDWLVLKKDIDEHQRKVLRLAKGKVPFALQRVLEAPGRMVGEVVQPLIPLAVIILGIVAIVYILPRVLPERR